MGYIEGGFLVCQGVGWLVGFCNVYVDGLDGGGDYATGYNEDDKAGRWMDG